MMLARGLGIFAVFALAVAPRLGAQPPVERFVADDTLRPYYEHAGFSWKIEPLPHFEMNFESNSEAEYRLSHWPG